MPRAKCRQTSSRSANTSPEIGPFGEEIDMNPLCRCRVSPQRQVAAIAGRVKSSEPSLDLTNPLLSTSSQRPATRGGNRLKEAKDYEQLDFGAGPVATLGE